MDAFAHQGELEITVISATIFSSDETADTYATVRCGKQQFTTYSVKGQGSLPTWNQSFKLKPEGSPILVEIFAVRPELDVLVGLATIQLSELPSIKEDTSLFPLTKPEGNVDAGQVKVSVKRLSKVIETSKEVEGKCRNDYASQQDFQPSAPTYPDPYAYGGPPAHEPSRSSTNEAAATFASLDIGKDTKRDGIYPSSEPKMYPPSDASKLPRQEEFSSYVYNSTPGNPQPELHYPPSSAHYPPQGTPYPQAEGKSHLEGSPAPYPQVSGPYPPPESATSGKSPASEAYPPAAYPPANYPAPDSGKSPASAYPPAGYPPPESGKSPASTYPPTAYPPAGYPPSAAPSSYPPYDHGKQGVEKSDTYPYAAPAYVDGENGKNKQSIDGKDKAEGVKERGLEGQVKGHHSSYGYAPGYGYPPGPPGYPAPGYMPPPAYGSVPPQGGYPPMPGYPPAPPPYGAYPPNVHGYPPPAQHGYPGAHGHTGLGVGGIVGSLVYGAIGHHGQGHGYGPGHGYGGYGHYKHGHGHKMKHFKHKHGKFGKFGKWK